MQNLKQWFVILDLQEIIEFIGNMQNPHDLDTLVCFLYFQEIIEFSREMQNPEIESLMYLGT